MKKQLHINVRLGMWIHMATYVNGQQPLETNQVVSHNLTNMILQLNLIILIKSISCVIK
jgi:hypothetical protein